MKILYVTTISLTINTFFKSHIEMLIKEGHQVDIACNYSELKIDDFFGELGCKFHQIDFSRNPLSLSNVKAYKQLNKIVDIEKYDIVHCHTPNASVITRLVCRKYRKKNNLRVFYTAHGFHFYKGAALLNWLVYYPVEKICSCWTDVLIAINQEDYNLAKEKMYAKRVEYVPGVGIDLTRFKNININKDEKRKEIGVPNDCIMLFSVGELNKNKNHQIIIKALSKLNDTNIHYVIAGVGDEKENLLGLAKKLGFAERVHLLGYRKDIPELNYVADIFCFPSIREGLGLAALEAMASNKPVVAAKNRGTLSFIIDSENGYLCECNLSEEFAKAIENLCKDEELRRKFISQSEKIIYDFSIDNVLLRLNKIYNSN